MWLSQIVVYCVNRCRAFLSMQSHIETVLFSVAIFVFHALPTSAAENVALKASEIKQITAVVDGQENKKHDPIASEQLVQSLEKDAISVRRDGETIRMRFLRGSKDLAPAIRDLQIMPHNLFEKKFNSALGPGSSGGGFSNYYSSFAKTKEDVQAMISQFNRLPPELLKDYLPPKYKQLITTKKLIQALEKIRISFFQEGMTVAPNGMVDILEADYVSQGDESYIILLKSFFEKYNSIAKDNQLSFLRARVILHEITHLFGVGTVEDKESWDLSFYLLLALSSEHRFCISTADCENPEIGIRKQYNNRTYELERLEKIKVEIEKVFNLSDLKTNADITHGLVSDVTSGYTLWKLSSTEAITILVPSDLKDIIPDDFKEITKNPFAAQLLASLSLQKNVSFVRYLNSINDQKSRLSCYDMSIFEARNGTLYSKHVFDQNNWNHSDEQKIISEQFFRDRGDCYGEKIERPNYRWSFDSQNKICIGQPAN